MEGFLRVVTHDYNQSGKERKNAMIIMEDVCKSLNSEQEQNACEYFLSKDPACMTGSDVGILLMFSCGAKITGAVLSRWKHLDLDKDKNGNYENAAITLYNNFCKQSRESDLPESEKDQGDYAIPLPDKGAEILEARAQYIQSYIRDHLDEAAALHKNLLKSGDTIEDMVDCIFQNMPIVCDNSDPLKQANPDLLAEDAKDFLREIGITEAQISSTGEYVKLIDAEKDTMVGYSVAAYIFRANLGTILSCSDKFFQQRNPGMMSAVASYILGVSPEEMDYICSDYGINRADIWESAQKLMRVRPLLSEIRCEHCGGIVNESLMGMILHQSTVEPWKLFPGMTCPHCNEILDWFEKL